MRVADAGFCIDRTEATRAEYSRFVAARRAFATPQDQPPECAWNDSFDPEQDDLNQGSANAPVAWVDWCDAVAYCAWAGKRLCGSVGDGSRLDVLQRTLGGEWFTACSEGGEKLYPYGNTFQPNACVGDGVATGLDREPVATRSGCEGGYPGLFDLSGNVREWENRCFSEDSGAGVGITCAMRGGGYYEQLADNLRCDNDQVKPANARTQALGIRCCSNWIE